MLADPAIHYAALWSALRVQSLLGSGSSGITMLKFMLWLVLLVLCWPLALIALVLWPFVWLLSLPFRLAGIAVEGVFALLRAAVMLPARLLGAR
ncbi:MAG TPA: hypothetical protein VMV25_01925 [Steroidobacteraceae bacterium]|nr:hypothetical protein [Steroidobacteraceae bacterium]